MAPALLTRLTNQLRAKGKSNAASMAAALLKKRGHLDSKGNLTSLGEKRQALGDDGRAKDRASKSSGRPSSDYKYNPTTNRATLKYKGRKKNGR